MTDTYAHTDVLGANVLQDLLAETQRAKVHGDKYASLHEAYGVLAEEVAELFDIVRLKRSKRLAEELRAELIQIASVAIKAIGSIDRFVEVPKPAPTLQEAAELIVRAARVEADAKLIFARMSAEQQRLFGEPTLGWDNLTEDSRNSFRTEAKRALAKEDAEATRPNISRSGNETTWDLAVNLYHVATNGGDLLVQPISTALIWYEEAAAQL